MSQKYVPYIKYVIAPDTRFERDFALFFDPKGPVSRGELLRNYGWREEAGFKKLIEALYVSSKGSIKGFEKYYEKKIRWSTGNIVDVLRGDDIIKDKLKGLIRVDLRKTMAVPVLLVEIVSLQHKFCNTCSRLWSAKSIRLPSPLRNYFEKLGITDKYLSKFRCTRHLCYELCGNYKYCELMYTSVEDKPDYESKIIDCIIELIKQIELKGTGSPSYQCRPWTREDHKKKRIGPLKPNSKCFERSVRVDFKPLKYFILDPKTWKDIEEHRYNKNPRNQFEAFPVDVFPNILDDRFLQATEISAPLRTSNGVLECFLRLADVKFEIKYDLEILCAVCNSQHKIFGVPIKAMFKSKDDQVFCHEAGLVNLLWRCLWDKHPKEMCAYFINQKSLRFDDFPVIKRELKVKAIARSPYENCSYDFAVYLDKLVSGDERIILFDLTTALWKKSGFHQEAREPDDYLKIWQETLCNIPNTVKDVVAVWYVVCNDTEERFFSGETPANVKNFSDLINLVTQQFPNSTLVIKNGAQLNQISFKHKLIVVPVFNSTPAKGEARRELKILWEVANNKNAGNRLLIKHVIDRLLC